MTTRTLLTSLCLVLAIPSGCATSDQDSKTRGSDVMIQMTGPQRDQADLVFHLRQQAKEFREMS